MNQMVQRIWCSILCVVGAHPSVTSVFAIICMRSCMYVPIMSSMYRVSQSLGLALFPVSRFPLPFLSLAHDHGWLLVLHRIQLRYRQRTHQHIHTRVHMSNNNTCIDARWRVMYKMRCDISHSCCDCPQAHVVRMEHVQPTCACDMLLACNISVISHRYMLMHMPMLQVSAVLSSFSSVCSGTSWYVAITCCC